MRVGKANGQEWLRLGEAADALGVSRNTLRRWSDTGEVTCYRSSGGHRRYRRSHVERLLQAHTATGRPQVATSLSHPSGRVPDREHLHAPLLTLAQVAADGIGVTSCVIALYAGDNTMHVLADYVRRGHPGHARASAAVPLAQAPIASEVLHNGRRLVIADLATTKLLTRSEADVYRSRGDTAILALPLLAEGRVVGSMELADVLSPRSFTGANIAFAEFIARQAARAIAGEPEGEEEAEPNPGDVSLDTAPHFGTDQRSTHDEDRAAVQALLDRLRARLQAVACDILRYLPDEGAFSVVAAAPSVGVAAIPTEQLHMVDDLPGAAAALTSKSVLHTALDTRQRGDAHLSPSVQEGASGVWRAPLRLDDKVLGLLEVFVTDPLPAFGANQLGLVEATATVVALTLGRSDQTAFATSDDRRHEEPIAGISSVQPGETQKPAQQGLAVLHAHPELDACSVYRVADGNATLFGRLAVEASPLPDTWCLDDHPPALLAIAERATFGIGATVDPRLAPEDAERFLKARGLAGAVLAPLVYEDRVVGLLEAGSTHLADLRSLSRTVEAAADLLAVTLATGDTISRLKRRNRDLELVVEAGLEDTARLSTEEVLHAVAERLSTLVHSPVVDIFAVEADTLRSLVSYDGGRFDTGWKGVVIPLLRYPSIGRAVDTGEITIAASLDDPALTEEGRYAMEKWGYQAQLSMPLIWSGRVIGLVQLSDYVPRSFGPDLDLIRGLGQVAAHALQNATLFEQVERRSRALNELVALGDLSGRTRDLDTLVRRMAERLQAAVGAANCDIFQVCDEGLRCVASYDRSGHDERLVGNILDPQCYPTVVAAINAHRILVVTSPDDPQLSDEERRTYREFGYASEVCIPLIVNDELYGAIDIYDTRERDYADFLGFFEGAGRMLAGACENALLFDQLERRTRVLREIVDLGAITSQTHDLQQVLNVIAARLRDTIEAADCDIFTLQDDQLRCVASVNEKGLDAGAIGQGFDMNRFPAAALALHNAEALAVATLDDPRLSNEERDEIRAYGYQSELCIPLVAGERVIGLIDVFDKRPRDFGEYLDFIKSVGRMAAGAIENALLLEELESTNHMLKLTLDASVRPNTAP